VQDADDISVSEMLHHHSRHDEVVIGDIDGRRDDVEVQELPITVGERRAMVFDDLADDVDAGVVDVGACLKESTHPLQISTRDIQQTNLFSAEISLQLIDNYVQTGNHLLSVIQRRTRS